MSRQRVYDLLNAAIAQYTNALPLQEGQKSLLKSSILNSLVQVGSSKDILLYKCIQYMLQIGPPVIELQNSLQHIEHGELADALQDANNMDDLWQKLLQKCLQSEDKDRYIDLSTVLTTENELLLHCKATASDSPNNPNKQLIDLFDKSRYNVRLLADLSVRTMTSNTVEFQIDEIWEIVRQRCSVFHNFHSLIISIYTKDCNYDISLFVITMYIVYYNAVFNPVIEEQKIPVKAQIDESADVTAPAATDDILDQLHVEDTVLDYEDPTDAIDPNMIDGDYPSDYEDDMNTQSVSDMLNEVISAEVPEDLPTENDDQSISVVENSVAPEIRVNKLPISKKDTAIALTNIQKFVNMNKNRFPEGVPKALLDIKEL
jgi:hypothetical protein